MSCTTCFGLGKVKARDFPTVYVDCACKRDANVEDVRRMLLERSQVGLKKYGCTTEGAGLSVRDWLQHALEETLDKAVYLRAAIRGIDDSTTPT